MTEPFGIEDVIYAFQQKLGCRHVSNEEAYLKHLNNYIEGDAYALGAAHLFTYSKEEQQNQAAFDDALMNRAVEVFSGGKTDLAYIKEGGNELVANYKTAVRKMVAHALMHDQADPAECHFLIYKNTESFNPYDIGHYPFGKVGKKFLDIKNIVGGVHLDENEQQLFKGQTEPVIDLLAEKILAQIQTLRLRDKQKAEGQPPLPPQ